MHRKLALPEHKLCKLRLLLITKRDLQPHIGKLDFAACVVFGGRTFLRRMIDTVNHMQRPRHHVRINAPLRADLEWWKEFLGDFNGKTFFVDSELVPTEEFSTDVYLIGGGEFFQGDWFYVNWATKYPSLANMHINLPETFTVLITLSTGKINYTISGSLFCTDNTTTLSAINKGTSVETFLALSDLQLLRQCIPTAVNMLANTISCIHDPAHCALLVEKLISCPLNKWPSVTPHLSRNAFHSLPLQVPSMLRNSNLMPS